MVADPGSTSMAEYWVCRFGLMFCTRQGDDPLADYYSAGEEFKDLAKTDMRNMRVESNRSVSSKSLAVSHVLRRKCYF